MSIPVAHQAADRGFDASLPVRDHGDVPATPPDRFRRVTSLSVVMPTTDFGTTFVRCARRVIERLRPDLGDEFIVSLDGAATPPPAWLTESGAVVLATGCVSGPAVARNLASTFTQGDVMVFVDADVELAPDCLDRVRAAFDADPDLTGIFGAYDADPAAPGLVSRFRNLLHHHTHVRHAGPAETFWAGCGAMRRRPFLDLGGFDPAYQLPSIEDIDLGARACAAGCRIRLDPSIRCRHHKRWTLVSMIQADVFRRAIPWTRQMLRTGTMPRRLSVDGRSRASGACALLTGASLIASVFEPMGLLASGGFLAVILVLNRDFYALCSRRYGAAFALGCFPLHWLYFTYATLAFGGVVIEQRLRRLLGNRG